MRTLILSVVLGTMLIAIGTIIVLDQTSHDDVPPRNGIRVFVTQKEPFLALAHSTQVKGVQVGTNKCNQYQGVATHAMTHGLRSCNTHFARPVHITKDANVQSGTLKARDVHIGGNNVRRSLQNVLALSKEITQLERRDEKIPV